MHVSVVSKKEKKKKKRNNVYVSRGNETDHNKGQWIWLIFWSYWNQAYDGSSEKYILSSKTTQDNEWLWVILKIQRYK